jgi:hypothetical protein
VRNFTPEAPVGDFYVAQDGHRVLRDLLDERYRFAASEFQFYPNSGQALDLSDLRGLALHSREFKAVVQAFNAQAFSRDALKIDLRREEWNVASPLLDHLGVRYFATGTGELPFGRVADDADLLWDRWASVDALPDEALTGTAPGPLNGMYVPMRAVGKNCEGALVRLSLVSGGRTVATSSRSSFDLGGGWTGFALLGRELAAGDQYRITATSDEPGCGVDVGMLGSRVARQAMIEDPGQAVRLVSTEQAWIYERPSAWELVTAHRRWRAFPSQAELLAWAVSRPPEDADVAAFVGRADGPAPAPGSGAAPVVVSSRIADNSVRVEVDGDSPALVVVSQNLADGWTARVDGRSAPLVAVDGALMGVFVPPGRHTVALDYLPRSFVVGSVVSGVAFLVALVALAVPRGRRRT